jgi:hypothetical protein
VIESAIRSTNVEAPGIRAEKAIWVRDRYVRSVGEPSPFVRSMSTV